MNEADYTTFDAERQALASTPQGWQLDLLTAEDLYKFANDRGVSWSAGAISGGDAIQRLWRLCLLRADVVVAPEPLCIEGLTCVGRSPDGRFAYVDCRRSLVAPNGLGSALTSMRDENDRAVPLFHRFRFYVLHRLAKSFESAGVTAQFLLYEPGLVGVAESTRQRLAIWTSTKEFTDIVATWNHQAEVPIALEPGTSEAIFRRLRWSLEDTERSIVRIIDDHRARVLPLLRDFGLSAIHELRHTFGIQAYWIDKNTTLQTLIRLLRAEEREKIVGQVGACMELLLMAEVVRRAAEVAFDTSLPEEDSIGPGTWYPGSRKVLYGTERVFDARPSALRDYLTSLGVDSATKVRCYVEGATEAGAIERLCRALGGIEVIDVHGRFVERGTGDIAFAESLKRDMSAGVFSLIVLDGDRDDNVRAVRRAAECDAMFGEFYVNVPDFELANFTAAEIIDVAFDMAPSGSLALEWKDEALKAVRGRQSFDEVCTVLGRLGATGLRKGRALGEALVERALLRLFESGHIDESEDNRMDQVGAALRRIASLLYRSARSRYSISREKTRTDPATGRLRDR